MQERQWEQHRELVKFCKAFKFERMGAFTYSDEDGTPAASLPDQVCMLYCDHLLEHVGPLCSLGMQGAEQYLVSLLTSMESLFVLVTGARLTLHWLHRCLQR